MSNFDVERWLCEHDLQVVRRNAWNGAQVWILDPCPFEPEHCRTYNTAVMQFPSGAVAFNCFGARCESKGWHALRDHVEPGWREHRQKEQVEDSRSRVKQFLGDGTIDLDALFADGTLDAVILLEVQDPATVAKLDDRLRPRNLIARFRQALKRRVQQRKAGRGTISTSTPVLLRTKLPSAPCPKDTVVPAGYGLTPTATVCRHRKGGEDIAPAPVLIVAKLRDVDEGTEAFRLTWFNQRQWRYTTADRAVALDAHELTSLANAGFPVSSVTARGMAEYLQAFEAANPNLPIENVSSHLGWQGKNGADGFLWGRTHLALAEDSPIAFRGLAAGDEQLTDGFRAAGSLEDWLAAVRQLGSYPRAALVFYTAFVPPLLEVLEAPNFILDLANRTTTGKTTAVRVAASVWGQPDETLPDSIVQSWDATKVWLERAPAVLSGLPLFLYDTKRPKSPGLVAGTLYAIAQGRGRGRGNVTGTERVRTWRTVAISTGEAPATSFTQDGGARMRCLELRGMPLERKDDDTRRIVDVLNLAVRHNYGHAGPLFVRFLIANQEVWPQLQASYLETLRIYAERDGRLAKYFGAICVAARLTHRLFELPWDCATVLKTVWPSLALEAEDAAGAARALDLAVD